MNTIFLKSFPDVLASVLDSTGRESPLGHKSPPGDAPTYGKSAENQWTSNISENGHVEGLLLHSHRRFFLFHDAKSGCEGCDDCGRYPILHPSFPHFRVSASVTGTVAAGKGRTGLRNNSERLEDPNGSNALFFFPK